MHTIPGGLELALGVTHKTHWRVLDRISSLRKPLKQGSFQGILASSWSENSAKLVDFRHIKSIFNIIKIQNFTI